MSKLAGKNKLPRRYSLKSKAEIDLLLKTGQRHSGAYFFLVWEKTDQFKYGIFVSRKFGNAVQRNRLKRLVREAIRLNLGILDLPVTMVIFPKPGIGKPDFETTNAEISRIFEHINART